MKSDFDVIIVGGGASGLMCAAYLTYIDSSLEVCVIERNDRVGKKLLTTGNGRCNFENLTVAASDYYSDNLSFVRNIMDEFDVSSVLSFFENNLGIVYDSVDNLVYPITYKSSTILDGLRFFIDSVTTIQEEVKTINRDGNIYLINGSYSSRYVVFACGGASFASTGSDGKLFPLIKKLAGNDSFSKIVPALVPFKTSDLDIKPLSGQKVKCKVTLEDYSESGELLFTDYGVSGIVVMQLSRHYYELIDKGIKPTLITVDLLPKLSLEEKKLTIERLFKAFPNRSKVQALTGLLCRQLAEVVLKRSGDSIDDIVNTIECFKINITGTLGFDNAQVTRGGLKLSSVSSNLELLNAANCYACGELLNVDGPCGGYNLNWAWASAMKVADSIYKDYKT